MYSTKLIVHRSNVLFKCMFQIQNVSSAIVESQLSVNTLRKCLVCDGSEDDCRSAIVKLAVCNYTSLYAHLVSICCLFLLSISLFLPSCRNRIAIVKLSFSSSSSCKILYRCQCENECIKNAHAFFSNNEKWRKVR